jgi:hypothetical protein
MHCTISFHSQLKHLKLFRLRKVSFSHSFPNAYRARRERKISCHTQCRESCSSGPSRPPFPRMITADEQPLQIHTVLPRLKNLIIMRYCIMHTVVGDFLSQFIRRVPVPYVPGNIKAIYGTWLLLGEALQGVFVLVHRLKVTIVSKQLFFGLGRLFRIWCGPVLCIFTFNKVLTEKTINSETKK